MDCVFESVATALNDLAKAALEYQQMEQSLLVALMADTGLSACEAKVRLNFLLGAQEQNTLDKLMSGDYVVH